ncbi:MAG: hypothetical protein GQ579_00665 [Bacteroidales bacterium]|nr:hypothetical protein [Bacteroidales bacterium]
MKYTFRILVLALLTASLSSCEGIRNLFDVEIETTIEGDLNFVTDEVELKSTEDVAFNASVTVPVLNDDLYEYEENIKDFMTSDVTIEVLSVDSADVILRSGSSFTIENVNASYIWTLTSDWPIEAGMSVTLNPASLDVIDDILEDMLPFTMSTSGTCNKGGVTIWLRYGIETKAVATPLD